MCLCTAREASTLHGCVCMQRVCKCIATGGLSACNVCVCMQWVCVHVMGVCVHAMGVHCTCACTHIVFTAHIYPGEHSPCTRRAFTCTHTHTHMQLCAWLEGLGVWVCARLHTDGVRNKGLRAPAGAGRVRFVCLPVGVCGRGWVWVHCVHRQVCARVCGSDGVCAPTVPVPGWVQRGG